MVTDPDDAEVTARGKVAVTVSLAAVRPVRVLPLGSVSAAARPLPLSLAGQYA
jgi:hypothetical protein